MDTLSKFSFEENEKFIKVFLPLPEGESGVYGLFESSDSSLVFELRTGPHSDVINLPAEDIHLSIVNATGYCPTSNNINGSSMQFEIEVERSSITVRSRNSEQYGLVSPLLEHEHFRLLFFLLPLKGPCIVPAITSSSDKSEHHIPFNRKTDPNGILVTNSIKPSTRRSRFNFKSGTTEKPNIRRTATMRSALRSTTKDQKVRYATYKQTNVRTTKPPDDVPYIDILKDKKTYEEVKRSTTNEINSQWSATFIVFFSLQVFIVSTFAIFGLSMCILLQCKPKDYSIYKSVDID
ncbi:hypothetical protein FO519_001372 [Halicephalobus sp. NKZ332]|nr:hypothetical protein FO519_001372 [Halicephalobus sp. NKZ332]